MQAVVLAAGKGSRLNPITLNRSKAMLPILGKPIVERVMEKLVRNGIREFVIVISPKDEEVEKYFRERSSRSGRSFGITSKSRCLLSRTFPISLKRSSGTRFPSWISRRGNCKAMSAWDRFAW